LDDKNFLELDCVLSRLKRRTLNERDELMARVAHQAQG